MIMESLVTSQRRNNRRETLLVRKVASTTNPALISSQQAKMRTSKLQKDIERQLRQRSNAQNLQVFIRLMQVDRFIDDAAKDAKTHPTTPPTTPTPMMNHTACDSDVTSDDVEPRASPRHKMNKQVSSKPSMMLNTWIGNDAGGFNDSWLVMRGRNIRLQHQDHVKSALTGTRDIKSANPWLQNTRGRTGGALTPRLLSRFGTPTFDPGPSDREVPSRCHSNALRRQDDLRCYSGKSSLARPKREEFKPNSVPPSSLKNRRTPESTRSIVIRIPDPGPS